MDIFLNPALNDYILQTTRQEPPLLARLRQETCDLHLNTDMLTGPVEGALLALLVKLSQAKTCLEVGTFTGYSALQIASALNDNGKLITCEIDPRCANLAKKYFSMSPDGHKIELLLGDATHTLPTLNHPFDFIFIDADKANYPLYYDLLLPKLNPGGLMVVDNALWQGLVVSPQDKRTKAIDALNQKARHDDRVETVMLPVRDGIFLIRKL